MCEELVRRWIGRGFTGCGFSQSLALSGRVAFGAFDRTAEPAEIDAIFDVAASQHLAAIVVLPEIRNEDALLGQLERLMTGPRWTVARTTTDGLETADLLIGMQWVTPESLSSTPMGFGPFPTMPVTRRAPYVCIATWPGGHENPHRRRPSPTRVDFLDVQIASSTVEYDTVWKSSVERTSQLLGETRDDARWYRDVAFRLSRAAASSSAAGFLRG